MAVVVASGGAVHVDVLAGALEWSPERVRLALDAAAVVLPAVGLRVVWLGDSAVELLADVALGEGAPTVSSKSIEAFGFQRDAARLVWQLSAKVRLSKS